MAIVVVSDTSPIRALNHLGLLDGLGEFLDQVLLPPAVLQELTFPSARYDVVDVSRYGHIVVRAPREGVWVERFM